MYKWQKPVSGGVLEWALFTLTTYSKEVDINSISLTKRPIIHSYKECESGSILINVEYYTNTGGVVLKQLKIDKEK